MPKLNDSAAERGGDGAAMADQSSGVDSDRADHVQPRDLSRTVLMVGTRNRGTSSEVLSNQRDRAGRDRRQRVAPFMQMNTHLCS
jgi:hypothetical protein